MFTQPSVYVAALLRVQYMRRQQNHHQSCIIHVAGKLGPAANLTVVYVVNCEDWIWAGQPCHRHPATARKWVGKTHQTDRNRKKRCGTLQVYLVEMFLYTSIFDYCLEYER